jgi:hypothetical protein
MSLPQIEEVRRRIENCKDKQIQMYLKALYLFAARGIEVAGKLTASDFVTNPEHQVYGPKGCDAWLDYTEPPDPSTLQVIRTLLKIQSQETSIDEAIAQLEKKVPVGVFKIKIAKQHLEPGETAPYRLIALPLVDEYEPWAKEMFGYFEAAGTDYVFADLSRQDVWHYITHTQRVFEDLHYRIKKYTYLRGLLLEDPEENKGFKVLSHNRKLKGHGIRHVRVDELLKRWNFDGVDIAAYVGWSMGKKDGPDMMSNYAEIREMWQRYIKKLCKPNNFKSGGVS